MATSLVSQIVEALGPTIVARIASSLGFDQSSTQKAINAAVPGLLAALISLVSKPQGANKLNDVVAKQPPGNAVEPGARNRWIRAKGLRR